MKTHFRYVSLVTVLLILRSTSQIPICFADRNLLTLESLSHGLCSKCTDLIEKKLHLPSKVQSNLFDFCSPSVFSSFC